MSRKPEGQGAETFVTFQTPGVPGAETFPTLGKQKGPGAETFIKHRRISYKFVRLDDMYYTTVMFVVSSDFKMIQK